MKPFGMVKIILATSLLASCSLQNSTAPIASATPVTPTAAPGLTTGMLQPGDMLGDMLLTTEQGDTPWIWDYCDGFATQVSECDIPPFSKIFIGYGNVADDLETLNAEWAQTTWLLFLDGHPVDLPAFGTNDYDVGLKHRLWNIVLEQVTPGEHSLNYIITFANETTDVTWIFTVAAPASRLELPDNAHELAFQGSSDKFADLEEFGGLLYSAVQAQELDPFWEAVVVTGQMPLVFGDRVAVFLYRGNGDSLNWKGDLTQPYARQGQTDLWALIQEFEPDARLDYRLEIDDDETILDPRNPLTQNGGLGANSVVRMPGYVYPEFTLPRENISHGALSDDTLITSRELGYDVNYRVYTPSGYESMGDLPVVYVTDGQDYSNPEFGALIIVLDNLIADGKIKPLIAVLIDPRDPVNGENRREKELVPASLDQCPFCDFLAGELVPVIDAAYQTDAMPDSRAVIGFSLGGQFTSQMGLMYPDVFHLIAIQSPYFHGHEWIFEGYGNENQPPVKIFLSHGSYDQGADSQRLNDLLKKEAYSFLYVETHDGHSWGNIRGLLDDMLIYFFGN